MNKTTTILTLLLTASLAGCLSDDSTPTHTGIMDADPTYADVQPDGPVTGLEFVTQTLNATGEPLPTGAGIWTFGDFVFGSARTHRFWVADVSDPEHPVVVYEAPEDSRTPYARDADMIVHEDGHRTLVLATQFDGMHFWDVTDPTMPEHLGVADVESNHNVAVIPGTPIVFNSRSGGADSTNDLVDASDPANPIVLGSYGTHGCHDITFFGKPGDLKFRAYCAGIERTEIWDMDDFHRGGGEDFGIELVGTVGCPEADPSADPADAQDCAQNSPFVGNPAFSSAPARTLHHLAMVNHDASVLIVGDEFNGGGTPGSCFAYNEETGQSTPLGALWFYDISDETAPVVLSWITPDTVAPDSEGAQPDPDNVQDTVTRAIDEQDPTVLTRLAPTSSVPNCTAHFGSLVPGEEKIVMAWYSAGVLLIDFTDPSAPAILDQVTSEGTNPWDARIHGGYVFTGDIGRGMDVLRLT